MSAILKFWTASWRVKVLTDAYNGFLSHFDLRGSQTFGVIQ
jgi:hypothetical protein